MVVLNMFKVSAVPPRGSAVLTVFGGAIRRSMTAPLRNHGDHGCATAIYVVQTPQWRRNILKVSAVPPRSSAILTVFRVATDGMTESLRNHGDHGGATAVYAVQAPPV